MHTILPLLKCPCYSFYPFINLTMTWTFQGSSPVQNIITLPPERYLLYHPKYNSSGPFKLAILSTPRLYVEQEGLPQPTVGWIPRKGVGLLRSSVVTGYSMMLKTITSIAVSRSGQAAVVIMPQLLISFTEGEGLSLPKLYISKAPESRGESASPPV